jgi:hypothetical protein
LPRICLKLAGFARQVAQKAVLHYLAIPYDLFFVRQRVSTPSRFCPSCGSEVDLKNSPTVSFNAPVQAPAPGSAGSSPNQSARTSSSSGSGYEAGYVPGATLAERYRIVSPLGKGGMGEVYRAEDMKLGQTVALKFLPQSLAKNPDALSRFTREVRLARQISHPNVCRVFDLGEIVDADKNLHTFLTMEFVDGEDLASLMRRIGRLPPDKALDIARQMCAGLAAAHEQEIIHRDLKPANVMLDGRGRVRITDFGLAGISAELRADHDRAGTPAYMSPEQFSGGELTEKSDLYSLGLVMYEVFTGKRAYNANTLNEMAQLREKSAITLPSTYVKEIDPLVERVIMRCLEKDPARRPASAIQIAAALPGGDPLAAALAAGETPSPEMVAAAGTDGALAPWVATAVLAGIIALLFGNVFLSSRAQLLNLLPVVKSPEILQEDSQTLLNRIGYDYVPADSGYWLSVDDAFWLYSSQVPAPGRYRDLGKEFPSPVNFFYRQSRRPFLTQIPYFALSREDPGTKIPGDAIVGFDEEGRFTYLLVGPLATQESGAPASVASSSGIVSPSQFIDWQPLFSAAQLDTKDLKAVPAGWYPDTPMDQQFAWEGEHDRSPVRVHAGSFHGKPVYFKVLGVWDKEALTDYSSGLGAYRLGSWLILILAFSTFCLCLFLAFRNVRMGRSDIRGGLRAGATLAICYTVFMIFNAHWGTGAVWKWNWWQTTVGFAAGIGLQCAVFYLGLEPYFRRTWPELLISWSRLLAGGFANALVGRDMLTGVFFGGLLALARHLQIALPYWFAIKAITPTAYTADRFASFAGDLTAGLINPFMYALGVLAVLFILLRIVRRKNVAIILLVAIGTLLHLQAENPWTMLPLSVAAAIVLVVCMLRNGILGLAVAFYTEFLLTHNTLTWDFSRWYAPFSVLALLLILAIALYGFLISLGGRRALAHVLQD